MQEFVDLAIQLINGVGFPIACTIALFYTQNTDRKQHKEEAAGFSTAIQNNTIAITRLVDKIEDMEEK